MKKRHAFAAIAAAVGGYFAGKFVKSKMETVLECSQTEYQRLLTLATMRNKAVHEGVNTIDMEVFEDVFHGISESFRLNHGIKLV